MEDESYQRPTPFMVRARISEGMFHDLVISYFFGLSAEQLNKQAGDSAEDRDLPRMPSAKTVNRLYDALGTYIYERTVLPILRSDTGSEIETSTISPQVLLAMILAEEIPKQFYAAPWNGKHLDIADEVTEDTEKLFQFARQTYRTPASILARAMLHALLKVDLGYNEPQRLLIDQSKFAEARKKVVYGWLAEEPLNLQEIDGRGKRAEPQRVPRTRNRPSKNEFIHNTKLESEITADLIIHFLMCLSAEETLRLIKENVSAKQAACYPSSKTVSTLYSQLGRYLFKRFYAHELNATEEASEPALLNSKLADIARTKLERSLEAMPYVSYHILAHDESWQTLNPDIDIEVRKIFAHRKGMARDPQMVMGLAKMRSLHGDHFSGPAKAANETGFWTMVACFMDWLRQDVSVRSDCPMPQFSTVADRRRG
jgi:hypothetical protein